MQVSQGWYNGREVAVGSLTDLWHKLQASNRDRQAEEAKVDSAGLRVSYTGMILQRKFTVTSENRRKSGNEVFLKN
jgi:hypothetical protein